MVRYHIYILLLLVCSTFCRCSSHGDITLPQQSTIEISCGVGEYSDSTSRTNPTSEDATERISFNVGDQIMLCATSTSTATPDNYRLYNLTESGWESPEEPFTWEEPTMRFIAYYPTTATPSSFDTPEDQSSKEKIALADLMRVDMSLSQPDDGGNIELLFSRQMAYIELSVKYGESYSAEENYISDIKIYDYVEENGTTTTTAITPYEASPGLYCAIIKGTSGEGTPPSYSLITFTDARGVEYYVENTTYLNPQYKHTISVLLESDLDCLTVESITVEPWSDTIYINGGDFSVTEVDSAKCIDFQDNTLKIALAQQHNYTLPSGVLAECIDINGNGEIEFTEAAAATQVAIGADYDPASYDDLYQYFNHITEFRHLKEIGTVKGDLDYAELPNLKILDLLATSSRQSYDLTCCPYLEELYLFASSSTKSVDLRSNIYITNLELRVEGMESIDLSNCADLKMLTLEHTPLTTLDLSYNTGLKSVTLETNSSLSELKMSGLTDLETLYCNVAGDIKSLDLSPFTNLRSLYWGYTGLTSLDVGANVNLTYLRLEESKVTELDISSNTLVSEFLARYVEELTISQSQSLSPGLAYWQSNIAVGAVVVIK